MRRFCLAILMAATTCVGAAMSENDEFKQAINYVFSGNTEGRTPQLLSSILDENNCIISVETPGNSWVYYLKEIKPNSVVIDEHNRKISFEGDNTIVEHTFEGLPKVEKDSGATSNELKTPSRRQDDGPRIHRYTKTGVFVCVSTLLVTLPSTTADSPPRPCDPMTMRSLPRSEAAAIMA
jgi:hypothetical protein